MPFLAYCTDREGSEEARRAALAEHLEYIESILNCIAVAGPARTESGGRPVASCFVYHTDDEQEARRLLENDPYFKAGIYADVALSFFTPAAGTWIGGKIW